jgi:hypothetical protein
MENDMKINDVVATNENNFRIIYNKPKTRLVIQDGLIYIDSSQEMPNAWRRLWYWVLLGWKWESLNQSEDKVMVKE